MLFREECLFTWEDAKMYCVLDNKDGKVIVENVSLTNEITYVSRENHRKNTTLPFFRSIFQDWEQEKKARGIKL
jgi:hypothetical protein